MTGVAVVIGYALLGSTWLIWKTGGEVQRQAFRYAKLSGFATLALIGLVSLWTPFLDAEFMHRWFAWPQVLFVAPVPTMVAFAAWVLFRGLQRGRERSPLLRLARAVRAVLRRPADQLLSLPGADVGHALGGRRTRLTSLAPFLLAQARPCWFR